jgi:hypothetical protein
VEVIAVNSAAQLRKPIGLTAVGQEIELTHERKGSGATAQVRFETGERTAAGQTVLP